MEMKIFRIKNDSVKRKYAIQHNFCSQHSFARINILRNINTYEYSGCNFKTKRTCYNYLQFLLT